VRMGPASSRSSWYSSSPRSTSKWTSNGLDEVREIEECGCEWDVNCSIKNMNVKPVSNERAILVVGREAGWWADILSIPSGIMTPSAAPKSKPVPSVESFAK